jgi:hypothetical protein
MKTLVIHPKDKTTDFLKSIYHGRGWTEITGGCTKEDVAKAIDEHDHIIIMGHGTPQGLLAMGNFSAKPAPKAPSKQLMAHAPVSKDDIKTLYKTTGAKPYIGAFDDGPDDGDDDDWFTTRQVSSYKPYHSKTYGSYSGNFQSLSTGYVIDDSNADQLRNKKVTAIWCNADQYMEWNNLSGFYTGMFVSDTSEATMIGCADTEQWQVDESNYAFAALVRLLVEYPSEETLKHIKIGYGKLAKRNAIAKYNYRRMYVRKADKDKVAAINE